MSYSHTTWSTAEDLLAGMLSDLQGSISKVRWPSAELQLHLAEALRTLQALTGIYEATSEPFTVSASTAFVDLPTSVPPLRGQTLRDRDVIGPIQYALYEPYDPIDGTGMSEMFTFDQITKAVQRRRDRFLMETLCQVTRTVTPTDPAVITADTESVELDEDTIAIVRAAWVDVGGPSGGLIGPLWPSSEWSARASSSRITGAPGVPNSYVSGPRTPFSIDLLPVPQSDGRLDLITVEAGATLVPGTGSGTLLGIPDDFAPAIKWGALADLLSKDGPARDYARSLFCERRYRMLVAAATARGVLVDARVNSRSAFMTTLKGADSGSPNWQSRSTDPRRGGMVIASVGLNLIALISPPSVDCQMEVTVRRNAPVPTSGSSALQIGKEWLDLLIGYAAHVAMFKIGGQEFAASTHLADSFFEACADYNEELRVAWEGMMVDEPDEQKKAQGVRRVTGGTVQ